MKRRFSFQPVALSILSLLLLPLIAALRARADQVETQNGDHYSGKVISLNADTLVLQSEVLGTVRLPRSKVTIIMLGTNAAAVLPLRVSPAPTVGQGPKRFPAPITATTPASIPARPPTQLLTSTAVPAPSQDFSAVIGQLRTNNTLVQQIQREYLAGAGPEANNRFNEMLNGLASGRISLGDLRAQAKNASDQMRAMQKDLGGDDSGALDGYISILDAFIREADSTGSGSSGTNSPLKLFDLEP